MAATFAFLVSAAFSAQSPLTGFTAFTAFANVTGCSPSQDPLPTFDPRKWDCLPQSKRTELLSRPVAPAFLIPLNREHRLHSALHRLKAKEDEALAVPESAASNALLAYLDGRALESMRTQALKEARLSIKRSEARILSLSVELRAAARAASDWIHRQPGRELSFNYRQRIIDAADAILTENRLLHAHSAERDKVNQQFDHDLNRVLAIQG